jgi:hypothetical protein
MKVYQFDLRVVLHDDAPESELLRRMTEIVEDLDGDPKADTSLDRAQAKAVLVNVQPVPGDPKDRTEWNTHACEAIDKSGASDCFADLRTIGQNDVGAG